MQARLKSPQRLCSILVLVLSLLFTQSLAIEKALAGNGTAERLSSFEQIGFDIRGSRGGNGDVSASYLTALEFIQRHDYQKPILFIADDDSLKILSRLTGQPVKSGSTISNQIRVFKPQDLPKHFAPIDLYVQLASPTQAVRHRDSLSFAKEKPKGTIPLREDAIVVTQTVFANTENSNPLKPYGSIRFGEVSDFDDYGTTHFMRTPGFDNKDSGIYFDPVADQIAKLSPEQRRDFAIQEAKVSGDSAVRSILEKKRLAGSKFALAYGLWRAEQQTQFRSYLEGLTKKRIGESFVFITPIEVDISSWPNELRKKIVLLPENVSGPAQAKPGTIYIKKTPFLNHKLFTGLLGASEIPPVVAGDGAVSAASRIGRPFVMTQVPWNERVVEQVGQRLSAEADLSLVKDVFPELGRTPSLENAIDLDSPEHVLRFQKLSRDLRYQSDVMIDAAHEIRKFELARREVGDLDGLYGFLKPFLREDAIAEVRVAATKALIDAAEGKAVNPFVFPEVANALLIEDGLSGNAFAKVRHAPLPTDSKYWEIIYAMLKQTSSINATQAASESAANQEKWPPEVAKKIRELMFEKQWFTASSAYDTILYKPGGPTTEDYQAIVKLANSDSPNAEFFKEDLPR